MGAIHKPYNECNSYNKHVDCKQFNIENIYFSQNNMIRAVTPTDAEAIVTIYNEYITGSTATFEMEPLSIESMRKRITSLLAQGPYLVYESEGEVVAYCYAHPWKERAAFCHTWETTVYVAPAYQRKGIGRMLMEKLIAHCREVGCHSLIACITAENVGSRRMHEQLGFSQVSLFKEVGYKFNRWLDVVDYELIISKQP